MVKKQKKKFRDKSIKNVKGNAKYETICKRFCNENYVRMHTWKSKYNLTR